MKFPKMQAWANANGWDAFDLTLEIRLAEQTNAPADALFSRTDGTWETWRSASPILQEFINRHMINKCGGIS